MIDLSKITGKKRIILALIFLGLLLIIMGMTVIGSVLIILGLVYRVFSQKGENKIENFTRQRPRKMRGSNRVYRENYTHLYPAMNYMQKCGENKGRTCGYVNCGDGGRCSYGKQDGRFHGITSINDAPLGKYRDINYNSKKTFPAGEGSLASSNGQVGSDGTCLSPNQMLAGPPNPRTKISPIITPPSLSREFWRANDFVNYPQINKETPFDTLKSGWETDREMVNMERSGLCNKPFYEPGYRECTIGDMGCVPEVDCRGSLTPCGPYGSGQVRQENIYKGIVLSSERDVLSSNADENIQRQTYHGGHPNHNQINLEGVGVPLIEEYRHDDRVKLVSEMGTGTDLEYRRSGSIPPNGCGNAQVCSDNQTYINKACGFNRNNTQLGLPINVQTLGYEATPENVENNINIHTNTLQPGYYTQSNVAEAINGNIGISFPQQFNPVTKVVDNQGLTYVQSDVGLQRKGREEYSPTPSNIYDPRFTGYGTSYRANENSLLGTVEHRYDDINQVRMPNYIVRSKIDFLPKASHYGPRYEEGNVSTKGIRKYAQSQWIDRTNSHRADLQERLMRKSNARMAQLRMAPIHNRSAMGTCGK